MSKIRNSAYALAATVALGAGTMAGAAPAEAKSVCSTTNVHCSMSYAKKVTAPLAYGAKGTQVTYLQRSLRNVRIQVAVTGKFDAQTAKALARYQATRKIAGTSNKTADSRTLAFLRAGAGDYSRTATAVKKPVVRATSIVTASTNSSRGQKAVAFAYAQIGKPYIYGATGPRGYDCSGLTGAAWRSAGVSVPRTSYGQMGLKRVSRSALQPGDIVVFYGGGHVGLYAGNGKVIHAPRTGQNVKVVPLSSMPFYAAVRPA